MAGFLTELLESIGVHLSDIERPYCLDLCLLFCKDQAHPLSDSAFEINRSRCLTRSMKVL